MIFIGRTKFSVFSTASGAWKATNGSRFKSQSEYKSYLFSDARLEPRITIFTKYSLPQIELASKGHDVTLLVSYSELLPEKYENQLIAAAAKYHFLILERQETGKAHVSLDSIAREKLAISNDPRQPFGIFRLDDDDILPADYFDQNAPYIKSEFVGMQISHGIGISAIYKDGTFFNARRTYHPMLNIGYTSIHNFDADGHMSKLPVTGHNVADRTYPVIMDSRKLGYLWTRHAAQDTALGLVEVDEDSLISAFKRHMDRHPAVNNMEEVYSAFPVLINHITNASTPESTREEMIDNPVELKAQGLRFKPKSVGGSVRITITANCDMKSEIRNSLISFIFVDEAGLRIDPELLDEHFKDQPISRSNNARIGWFRYMSSKPGLNRTVTAFTLPKGVYLAVASIMKWRNRDTKIIVTGLSVESRPLL